MINMMLMMEMAVVGMVMIELVPLDTLYIQMKIGTASTLLSSLASANIQIQILHIVT